MARALLAENPVLVLDEPTAHLDAASTLRVFDAVRRRVIDGMTLLVATHNPEVLEHVDRVVRMRDGRIEGASGPTDAPGPAAMPATLPGLEGE